MLEVPRRCSRCCSLFVRVTESASTIFSTTSSWVAKMSVRSRSKRSAQRWPPSVASISCAVMRTRLPDLADTAFEHEAHAKIAPDLLHLDRPALVGKRRVARDHEQARDLREIGDQVFGDAVAEIVLLDIAAHVHERQHGDRRLLRQWRRLWLRQHRPRARQRDPEHPDRNRRCSSAAFRPDPRPRSPACRGRNRAPRARHRPFPVPQCPPGAPPRSRRRRRMSPSSTMTSPRLMPMRNSIR